MSDKYVLNSAGEPVMEPDLMAWANWYETAKRHISDELFAIEGQGDIRVSTVFLGMDHSWSGGPPVLWETMVFGGKLDQEQDRCSGNREQAEAMHAKMVCRVKSTP